MKGNKHLSLMGMVYQILNQIEMTNEYLTVNELSKMHNVSARNIRKKVTLLSKEKTKELIHKDANHQWKIHQILASKFKPIRNQKSRYYALTIDLARTYKPHEIKLIMDFVCSQTSDCNLEVNYAVEQKKSNNHSHLHCYIRCNQRKRLIENLQLGFSRISYKEAEIFDLSGWKNYMQKEGNTITTITKK